MTLLRRASLLALLAIAGLTVAGPDASAQTDVAPSCAEGPERVGDSIVGTPCADKIVASPSIAAVDGGGGNDTIVSAPIAAGAPCTGECRHLGVGSQTFNGGPGNDVIFGDRGNDRLNGGEGEDSLYGGIGDDELHGGPGDDLLSGGFGADSIDGEAGNDFVRGDATLDRIVDSGGDGGDTLSFATGVTPGFPNNPAQGYPSFSSYAGFPGAGGERGVYVELEAEDGSLADNGVAPDGGGVDGGLVENDDLQGTDFETIIGTPFSDFIVGSASGETIYGGGGADVILGEGGDDTIDGGADGDRCEDATAETSCENAGGGGVETRDQSKVSVGLMAPGDGSEPALYLTGSTGNDSATATYAEGSTDTVTFALSSGTFDPESFAGGGCQSQSGKAVCQLSEAPDSLVLAGMGGNDSLSTSGFPDTTSVVEIGGAGEDTLTGADASEDVLADGPGDDTLNGKGDDDALLNNEGRDTLDGSTGSDLFLSDSICDDDTIYGGEGDYRDNASWTKLDEPVAARLDTGLVGHPVGGQPNCSAGGELDHLQSIEDLEGTRFGDFFHGDGANNQLLGHLGADTYFALAGEDTILANSADSDLVIDCGGDAGDTAFIDRPTSAYQDPAPVGCEDVFEADPNNFRPPETPTGPISPPVQPSAPPKKKPVQRDRTPPRTRFLHRPAKTVFATHRFRSVSFAFAANEAGSTFRCRLDKGSFKPCRLASPLPPIARSAHAAGLRHRPRRQPRPLPGAVLLRDSPSLTAAGAKAAVAAGGFAQRLHLDRIGEGNRRNHQLRDPVARLDPKGLGRVGIEQQHPHFAPVAGIDQPRAVDQRDPMVTRKPRPRQHEPSMPLRNLNRHPSANTPPLPGPQMSSLAGIEIDTSISIMGAQRYPGLVLQLFNAQLHRRAPYNARMRSVGVSLRAAASSFSPRMLPRPAANSPGEKPSKRRDTPTLPSLSSVSSTQILEPVQLSHRHLGPHEHTILPLGPGQVASHLVQLMQPRALAVGDEQLDLGQGVFECPLDPLPQCLDALVGQRGDQHRPRMAQQRLAAPVFVEQVDLVEHQQARLVARADLLQHRIDRLEVRKPALLGRCCIDHLQDQVGEDRLLEGCLEGLDQLVGQLLDEADRVGEEEVPAGEGDAARGRVERVEEPVPHADLLSSGKGVEQGRLAGVGVAGEGDPGQRRLLSPRPHHSAVALQPAQPAPQRGDPVAGEAPIGLDLALTRAPGADPATEALEVGPQTTHPRQVVFELGQLDLELALGRVCVVSEDVEDDGGAIDYRHTQRALEVALLSGCELVVAGGQVRVAGGDLLLDLGQLAATEIAVGVGFSALLNRLARGRYAGGTEQFLKLGERVAVLAAVGNADRQGSLAGARIGDASAVGGVVRLLVAPVPGSIHSL